MSDINAPNHAPPHILRDLLFGIFLTLLLLGAKLLFAQTRLYSVISGVTYEWMQSLLRPNPAQPLPRIVVVDFSEIPADRKNDQGALYTPRDKLQALIEGVASHDPKPRAIGVDINFSTDIHDKGPFHTPEDEGFLEFCLRKQQELHIPIVVGAAESVGRGPAEILGKPRFLSLAGYMMWPRSFSDTPSPKMYEWIEIGYINPNTGKLAIHRFRSFAAVLTNSNVKEVPWFLRLVVDKSDFQGEPKTGDKSLPPLARPRMFDVDYSRIQDFRANAIPATDGSSVAEDDRMGDAIVILGRGDKAKLTGIGTQSADIFTIAKLGADTYPGVFLHAAAADTLSHGAPLWHLTPLGGTVADVILSFFVFGFVALIRVFYRRKWGADVNQERIAKLLTWLLILALAVFGFSLLNFHHLLWEDILIVMFVLFLHSVLEGPTGTVGEAICRSLEDLTHFYLRLRVGPEPKS
jgi:CHASE2 domain-containing sensor protein